MEEEEARVISGRGWENQSRFVAVKLLFRIFAEDNEDDDFTEVKAVTVVEPVNPLVDDAMASGDHKEASDDEAMLLSRLLSVTKAARNKLARSKSFSSSTALRLDLLKYGSTGRSHIPLIFSQGAILIHAVFFIRDVGKFQLVTILLFVSYFLIVKIHKND